MRIINFLMKKIIVLLFLLMFLLLVSQTQAIGFGSLQKTKNLEIFAVSTKTAEILFGVLVKMNLI